MTVTDQSRTLRLRHTIEELAVLADLLEVSSLPGVRPVEPGLAVRSQATRSLVAQGLLTMPEGGGVEIGLPLGAVIASMLDAPTIVQVAKHADGEVETWTWFGDDAAVIQVSDADDGIVTITVHEADLDAAVLASVGITDPTDSREAPSAVAAVEVITLATEGTTTTSDLTRYAQSPDLTWVRIVPTKASEVDR